MNYLIRRNPIICTLGETILDESRDWAWKLMEDEGMAGRFMPNFTFFFRQLGTNFAWKWFSLSKLHCFTLTHRCKMWDTIFAEKMKVTVAEFHLLRRINNKKRHTAPYLLCEIILVNCMSNVNFYCFASSWPFNEVGRHGVILSRGNTVGNTT